MRFRGESKKEQNFVRRFDQQGAHQHLGQGSTKIFIAYGHCASERSCSGEAAAFFKDKRTTSPCSLDDSTFEQPLSWFAGSRRPLCKRLVFPNTRVTRYVGMLTPLTRLSARLFPCFCISSRSRFSIIGAAAGSLFVFKGVYKAVLINYPSRAEKQVIFAGVQAGTLA